MPKCRVYGQPASKGSLRCLGRGRHIESARGLPAWMQAVRDAWQAHCPEHVAAPGQCYSVGLIFVMPWPASYGPTPTREHACRRRPDLDKLTRGVLDALTGMAWHDDSEVAALHARKIYAYDREPSGCVIDVITMERTHPRT
jgi:crossover junction endodeoxyribonuclease RusA